MIADEQRIVEHVQSIASSSADAEVTGVYCNCLKCRRPVAIGDDEETAKPSAIVEFKPSAKPSAIVEFKPSAKPSAIIESMAGPVPAKPSASSAIVAYVPPSALLDDELEQAVASLPQCQPMYTKGRRQSKRQKN